MVLPVVSQGEDHGFKPRTSEFPNSREKLHYDIYHMLYDEGKCRRKTCLNILTNGTENASNDFLKLRIMLSVPRWLGCKWAITVSFVAYMPFIAAQFYPRLYTLIPAGMMVGFGGGPLWCAKCTYLSVVSMQSKSLLRKSKIGPRLFPS